MLENARACACSEVRIAAGQPRLAPVAHRRDVDGPGIDGARLDGAWRKARRIGSQQGSLSLAIVHELVALYGGKVTLGAAPIGGLRVELMLPAAPQHRAG